MRRHTFTWSIFIASAIAVPPASAQSSAVAVFGDQQIGSVELERRVEPKLIHERVREYEIRRRELDDMLEQRLLAWKAGKLGITVDELVRREISGKVLRPGPGEVASAYLTAKGRIKDAPPEEGMRMMAESITTFRESERRRAYLKELKAEAHARVLLAPPRVTVDPGAGPALGVSSAPVTVVEFADFQCPFCASLAPLLAQLPVKYGDKVRVVYRNFPLATHRDAKPAAEAAACANEQGGFWKYAEQLYANQGHLAPDDLQSYAGAAGLDLAAFASCIASERHRSSWSEDVAAGEAVGVASTPVIFVNGRPIYGAVSADMLWDVIDEELSASSHTLNTSR